MTQVFLSYSRNDLEAALRLRDALEKSGISVFKDDVAIRAGDRWMEKLESALKECQSYVLLAGRDGVRRWVGAEAQIALNRHLSPQDDAERLPIFPILLETGQPEDLPPFLALFQAVRWNPAEALPDDLLEAIRAHTIRYDQPPAYEGCPFLGLTAFRQKDARLFFGRRRETLDALSGLGDQNQGNPESLSLAPGGGYSRWLQIEGNSGAGKSSLVMAGMLPLIERGVLWARTGFERWHVLGPLLPGKNPLARLAEVLEHDLIADPARRDSLGLLSRLEGDERALAFRLKDFKENGTAFLLAIDQFEELFTLAEDGPRRQFDALLAHALQDPACPLFLISTVRADFLNRYECLPRLLELYNSRCRRYFLPGISAQGLREVIEQPARLAGLDVSEITEAMLLEARDEVGALPLVENALTVLWNQRTGQRLSGESYRAANGIAGMLSSQADALLSRIDQSLPKGRHLALELLLRLTRIHEEGRHSRQRITWEEAVLVAGGGDSAKGEKLVQWLAGARPEEGATEAARGSLRLLTITTEGPKDAPQRHVDLIHETLIRARGRDDKTGNTIGYWPTLYDYIEANRDRDLQWQQLRHDAQRWQASRFLGSWWNLAGLGGLLRYRRLPLAKRSLERRFRRWSLAGLLVHTTLALAVIGVFAESADWANENKLPPNYVLWKFFWLLGYEPLPEMVEIKPPAKGSFIMGCKPERDTAEVTYISKDGSIRKRTYSCRDSETLPVALSRAYAIGRYEVSFLQYDYYVWQQKSSRKGDRLKYPLDHGWGRGAMPVINVSWEEATDYLAWLNRRNSPNCGKTKQCYRLPTEAEWEYAARGGHDEDDDSPFGWQGKAFEPAKANCGEDRPLSTDRSNSWANGFELHDMVGNVEEWAYSRTANAPPAALVGGSWGVLASGCRIAHRGGFPLGRSSSVGFRVCRGSPIEPRDAGASDTGKQNP